MTSGTPEPAFVLLHDFAASSREWRHVAERAGVPVLHPDLPGFGSAADEPATGVEGMAEHVLGAVEQAGLQHYVLAGCGLGARVAVEAAARRPSGLVGLALVAPLSLTGDALGDELRESLRAAHGDADALRAYHRGLTRSPLDDIDLDALVLDGRRASREAWDRWLDEGSRQDLSDRAARVDVPVLVLSAGDDPLEGAQRATQQLAELLPDARSCTCEGAGHLLPLEQPRWVTRELLHWARGLHGPGQWGEGARS